jgi:diphthamide synthase
MMRTMSTTLSGLAGVPVWCSWSGGKDSALALHETMRAGAKPRFLVAMLTEGGERSRSHGLSRGLLAAQAAAVGLPIRFGAATWAGYREELLRVMREGVAASVRAPGFSATSTWTTTASGKRGFAPRWAWRRCCRFGTAIVVR